MDLLNTIPVENRLRVPMCEDSRSLNLANTVAVVLYEAWRQLGFPGGS
jgi:tRNA (cytidine/uridine-2'-O-)-methyltransferase